MRGTMRIALAAAACGGCAPAPAPTEPTVPKIVVEPAGELEVTEVPVAAGTVDLEHTPEDHAEGDGRTCPPSVANTQWTNLRRIAGDRIEKGLRRSGFGCRELDEGGKLELAVTLEPSGCYAFVALGEEMEVDIALAAAPPSFIPHGKGGIILAVDEDVGATAIIGEKSCFRMPLPIPLPARVSAKATRGHGAVALAIYTK